MLDQKIGFCSAKDGVQICYSTVGEGPPLVKAPNWISHLEFEWESPVWRHWWRELSQHNTLVRFDQRGSGLSDRDVEDASFERWVDDLETVVDTVGLDRFPILGISQGGAVAIEYALRFPEKVSHLILFGAYSNGWKKRDDRHVELVEALITVTREGWGANIPAYRQIFTSRFIPGATSEQMDWFNELQRISTSASNAARILIETGEIDILDHLGQVTTPTLVLHSRKDVVVPFDQGRRLAALIPNSEFIPLDSANHLILEDEPAWPAALRAMHRFLGQESSERNMAVPAASATMNQNNLTAREVEVLRLVSEGKSNPQIADELFISAKTVGNHVSSILNKTGTSSRSEAAAHAVRNGLA